jgi:uncharacterized phosphosugar-binding protein
MAVIDRFYTAVQEILNRIVTEERDQIKKASDLIAEAVAQDRVLFVFGTGGHSYMAGEEIFYRAGGLACVNSVLDAGVSLIHGARRTTRIERTPGYAKAVLAGYGLRRDDVILIVNNSGLNAVTIDGANYAKEQGAKVIGVSSIDCSKPVPADLPARHPSAKNLFEVVDFHIDTHVPFGDATVKVEGCEQEVAPASTIAIAFILQSMIAGAVEKLVEMGVEPPVIRGLNIPGGDEVSKVYLDRYADRIKHL